MIELLKTLRPGETITFATDREGLVDVVLSKRDQCLRKHMSEHCVSTDFMDQSAIPFDQFLTTWMRDLREKVDRLAS